MSVLSQKLQRAYDAGFAYRTKLYWEAGDQFNHDEILKEASKHFKDKLYDAWCKGFIDSEARLKKQVARDEVVLEQRTKCDITMGRIPGG